MCGGGDVVGEDYIEGYEGGCDGEDVFGVVVFGCGGVV